MKIRQWSFRILLAVLFCACAVIGRVSFVDAASVPVLVKDIETRIKDNSNIRNMTAGGNILFFTAFDQSHGNELWKSDGTAAGTVMVKDIRPGTGDSYHAPNYLTYWNGMAYFEAYGPNGWSLWKSDGTAGNTVEVSSDVDPGQSVIFKGALYFKAYGDGLWKSNGTNAGTVAVLGGIGSIDNLVVVGNRLYFTIGNDLWTSDGTTAGTILLQADIYPDQLTDVNGTLYFYGWDDAAGSYRLFTSNGTTVGTVPYAATPDNLTNVNGTLYFTADDPVSGPSLLKLVAGVPTVVKNGMSAPSSFVSWNNILYFENANGLWTSNGTAAGTVVVKASIWPSQLTVVGNFLYFEGWDNPHGYELWKSDGTAAGTIMVKDIFPGTTNSDIEQLTNVNGTLFLRAKEPATGTQLWKIDGSDAVLVRNISPGTRDSSPANFLDVNGTLYFAANDTENGTKLWQSNGTSAATSMVPGFTGVNPVPLANVNGTLYFAGNSDDLWKREGSSPAVLVKAGVTTNDPTMVCAINGTLYFRGWDSAHGWELWKSNGSAAGTVMVKDLQTGTGASNPYALTSLNGILYFIATSGGKTQLWRSDGTDAGTLVVDSSITAVTDLLVANGKLFFQGNDTSNTDALWVSDGTTTSVLKNNLSPTKLTAVGNTLFFQGWTSPLGYELWRSDGTVAGTINLTNINPSGSTNPNHLTNVNGTLFFTVWNPWGATDHDQLWKSDGTPEGAVLVKDLPADYGFASIDSLTSVHGILAFTFMDKSYYPTRDDSAELWISNGTAAGTVKVAEIFPGDLGSAPDNLTMANTPPNGIDKEALFFSAIDPLAGKELFILDFTPPASAITAPLNNAYLKGTSFIISGTAGDSMPGTGVNLVQVSTDNGTTWHDAIDTTAAGNVPWSSWQYTWSNPMDGVYIIKSRATDLATNVQTPLATITVTVDNTLPTSAIGQATYYFRGTSGVIGGTANDNLSGVNLVEVSTDNGVSWHSATPNGTWSTWQYSWTPLPADGQYAIKSRSTDRSGNIQSPSASSTAVIDNVAPTSSITTPANNTYFHVTSTTVGGTAGDDRSGIAKVEVSVNNGAWQTATYTAATGTWQLTASLPAANGQYTVRSRSTDRAGNVQTPSSITITIDTTPRTLYIDFSGTGDGSVTFVEKNQVCTSDCQASVYVGDPVTLQASPDQYSLFGGWSNACSGNSCTFTVPTPASVTASAAFALDADHQVMVEPNYYASIMEAYNALQTTDGALIRIWGIELSEPLLFDKGKLVTLMGGDNGAHTSNTGGMTTVQGTTTVTNGQITVENLTIR